MDLTFFFLGIFAEKLFFSLTIFFLLSISKKIFAIAQSKITFALIP